MSIIFLVINPSGGAGKTTLCEEFLVPRLRDTRKKVVHFKYGCDESEGFGNDAIKVSPFGSLGLCSHLDIIEYMFSRLEERIGDCEDFAAVFEVGSGQWFRYMVNDYFFFLAKLYSCNSVKVVVPSNNIWTFEIFKESINKVCCALENLHSMTREDLDVKLLSVRDSEGETWLEIDQNKKKKCWLKEIDNMIDCGDVPYIGAMKRFKFRHECWKNQLIRINNILGSATFSCEKSEKDREEQLSKVISKMSNIKVDILDIERINAVADLLID